MQVPACAQDVGHHAASLLTRLNLQREQGQFCDCVLRQKQNPDQIYPAHRCVLAASSPVLASILPSAGALVELQDPCLPDSVLVFLLDYIYTGVLPCSLSQQLYPRLLSAACHLQMKELQEALRAAWRQMGTEDNGNASNESDLKTFSELSLSPDEATLEEAQMTSVSIKDKEKGTDENDSNHPSRTDVRTLNSLKNVGELKSSGDESKVITQQSLMQNNPVLTEVHVYEDMHEHQCHSDGFVKLNICPASTEEELLETSKLRRRSSSSSSTSSHRCFGAVPVICHSSRAAVLPSPVSSIIITEHKDQAEEQNQDTRNKTNPPELNDSSNSSPTDRSTPNSELLIQGLTHNIDDQHAECDSFQSDVSLVPQNKDWSKGSKRQTERDFDRFFSKRRRLDCSECPNESLTAATEGQTKDWGSVVSLPEKVSDAGSDFHCGGGLAGEAKQEHLFSTRLLAKADREDSNCKRYRSETDKYQNHFGAERSRNVSIQHGYRSNSTSTSSESGLDDAFASECCKSSESREISSSKTSYLSPMTPVEHSMSDPTGETTAQPYHGHLHYQYFPHQDTQDYKCKNSQHSYSYGLDDSTDEEEDASLAVKQKPNQVLLLDISSKPTEPPCKAKFDIEEKWVLKGNKESSVSRDEGCIETNEQRNYETKNSSEKDQHKTEVPAAQNRWSVCSTASVTDSEHDSMPSTSSSYVPSSLPASVQGERSAPNPQPFQCSLCDRSFSQRGSLNRHVRSHLGVRPFPCPCCPMTFSRQYRVTEHMRVHQRCSLGNGFQKPVDSSSQVNEERPQN